MDQLIPVSVLPNQSMTISLAVNGTILTLNLAFHYNSQGGFWVMDIADKSGNPIVTSVPLLTGVWPGANILAPYDYMQIGSAYLINQSGAVTDWPDDTNLGTGFCMVWSDN